MRNCMNHPAKTAIKTTWNDHPGNIPKRINTVAEDEFSMLDISTNDQEITKTININSR